MSPSELETFLNQKIDAVVSGFPQWRFDRSVIEDGLHENRPTKVYFASKPNGVQVECDAAGVVKVIFIHSSGHEGFEGYRDPVAGVELSWDRARIRARLGAPSHRTEAQSIPGIGSYGPSDRYDYPSHSIHFQFHRTEPRVDLITLMAPERVPKRLMK